MVNYRGFLLATTSGFAAASGAQAADLPLKGPAPVMVPTALWEGSYIGLHAGAYWHQASANQAIGYDMHADNTGFIGGGQIGYNWQHGNFVYGLEADISGLTGRATASHGVDTPDKTVHARINWLSTFRGRAGLAVGDTLAYVTAGLAVGGVKNDMINSPTSSPTFKSESKTRVGWTVGGGVEHMWTRNWTVGLEALFVDLGRSTARSVTDSSKTTKFSNQAVIGRLKINYKF